MRTRPLAAAGTVLLAALAAAGCTSGSSPASGHSGSPGGGTPAVTAPGSLRWHACTGSQNLRCASLSVPLNYGSPSGRKITLALSEVPATAPASQRQGILLVNPGGPGASGLSLASFVAQGLQPSVAARYDIIGFDTRGVGASVPALHCDPAFFARERPAYVPRSAAAEQVLIGRARTYAADCGKKYGWLLPYLTTANIARDMDQIRAAAGQSKLSYFGYSYGTYLGQVYATLFPHRVHRMVLDSTVDPTGAWFKDNIEQDYAFQGRMNAFEAWAAKANGTYHLGSTAAQVNSIWNRSLARLAAHPVHQQSGPAIGPAEFTDTFVAAGYDNGYWPLLAAAMAGDARGSDSQPYLAVQPDREDTGERVRGVQRGRVRRRGLAALVVVLEHRQPQGVPVRAAGDLGQRVVQRGLRVLAGARPGQADADRRARPARHPHAAGHAGPGHAVRRRRRTRTGLLPTAKMVVVQGGGNHGQSLAYPANTCVNGYLNRYLATGALPAKPGPVNAVCPALPPPSPG